MEEEKIQNFTYTSENGEQRTGNLKSKNKKKVAFIYNCDIKLPENPVDEYFIKSVEDIIKKADERKPIVSIGNEGRQHWYNPGTQELLPFKTYNDEKDDFVPSKPARIQLSAREGIIADFLNNWIPGAKEDFQDSLLDLKKAFNKMEQEEYEVELDIFQDQMEECFENCYLDFFDDPQKERVGTTLQECINLIDKFTHNNVIADELHTLFALMKEEIEEKV